MVGAVALTTKGTLSPFLEKVGCELLCLLLTPRGGKALLTKCVWICAGVCLLRIKAA